MHLQYRWDTAQELLEGRRASGARQRTHLWRATLPTDLAEGDHTIEVRATDMFGRTFTQRKAYSIARKD